MITTHLDDIVCEFKQAVATNSDIRTHADCLPQYSAGRGAPVTPEDRRTIMTYRLERSEESLRAARLKTCWGGLFG